MSSSTALLPVGVQRVWLGMLLGAALLSSHARADAPWPKQLIRIVAPSPPGSYSDTIARPMVEYLSHALRQPVIIENRPGVNSSSGVGEVARAKPDGHTIVITNSSSITVNPQLYKKLSYTPDQLTPITPVLQGHFVLSVNPQWAKAKEIETASDLMAWAKAHPGQLRYASAGVGNIAHLTFAMLSSREGLDALHVPYRGQSAAQLALISGQVEAMFDIGSNTAAFQSGKSKPLAVTAERRLARLPHVETMAEAGLSGYEVSYWMGFLTTAGTPSDTVDRLHTVLNSAMQQPKIRESLALQGDIHTESTEAFAARIAREIPMWGEIIQREKLTVD